jgi:hypothetical protein
MCFSLQNDPTCPFVPDRNILSDGGLIKYNIGKNISTSAIQSWIHKSLIEFYNSKGYNGNNILQGLINNSRNDSVGITSVLKRITNLADYLISIFSQSIIRSADYDVRCFRPIRYHPGHEYDMSMCDTTTSNNEIDLYRSYLIRALKDQIDHLLRYKLFITRTIDLPIGDNNTISRSEFNDMIRICTNMQSAISNVANYVNISIMLHRNLKAFVMQLLTTPQKIVHNMFRDVVDNTFFIFFKGFNDLLLNETMLNANSPENILISHMHTWHATCTEKYGGMIQSGPILLHGQIDYPSNFHVDMDYRKISKDYDLSKANCLLSEILEVNVNEILYNQHKTRYLELKEESNF